MLSKPHRQFCEGIVTGLSGVRAYQAAYPRCSLKTARFNASHLRAKPHIQQEIARLRAQAESIAGPAVLTLVERRQWLARVVRANLALLDPEMDGDLLVSLQLEEGDNDQQIRKLRIADKIAAIKLDHQLSGDDANAPKSDPVRDSLAAMLKRVVEENSAAAEAAMRSPATSPPLGARVFTSAGSQPYQAPIPNPTASRPPDTGPAASSRLSSVAEARSSEASPSTSVNGMDTMDGMVAGSSEVSPCPSSAAASLSPGTAAPLPHQTVPPDPAAAPSSPAAHIPGSDYTPPVFHSRPRFYPGPDYNPRRVHTISPLDPPLSYRTT